MKTEWFVYIVRCSDSSLYTGITTDLERRITEHNSLKKGARYTRTRRPVQLLYFEEVPSRSTAAKREYAIKKLNQQGKYALLKEMGL